MASASAAIVASSLTSVTVETAYGRVTLTKAAGERTQCIRYAGRDYLLRPKTPTAPITGLLAALDDSLAAHVLAALLPRAHLTWEWPVHPPAPLPSPVEDPAPRQARFRLPGTLAEHPGLAAAYQSFVAPLLLEIDAADLRAHVARLFDSGEISWSTVLGNTIATRGMLEQYCGRLAFLGGLSAQVVLRAIGYVGARAFPDSKPGWMIVPRHGTVGVSSWGDQLTTVVLQPAYRAPHPLVEAAGLCAGLDVALAAPTRCPVVRLTGEHVVASPGLGTLFVTGLALVMPDGDRVPIARTLPAFTLHASQPIADAFDEPIATAIREVTAGPDAVDLLIVPLPANHPPAASRRSPGTTRSRGASKAASRSRAAAPDALGPDAGTIAHIQHVVDDDPDFPTWVILAMSQTEEWPFSWTEFALGTHVGAPFDDRGFRRRLRAQLDADLGCPDRSPTPPTPDVVLQMAPAVAVRVIGARLGELGERVLAAQPTPPAGVVRAPASRDPETWLQVAPLTPFVRWLSDIWLPAVCDAVLTAARRAGRRPDVSDLGGVEYWLSCGAEGTIAHALRTRLAWVRQQATEFLHDERQITEALVSGLDGRAAEGMARAAFGERVWPAAWEAALAGTAFAGVGAEIRETAVEALLVAAYRLGRTADALTPVHQVMLDEAQALAATYATDAAAARLAAGQFVQSGRLATFGRDVQGRLAVTAAMQAALEHVAEGAHPLGRHDFRREWYGEQEDRTGPRPAPAVDDVGRQAAREAERMVRARLKAGEYVRLHEILPYLTAKEALREIVESDVGTAMAPEWASGLGPDALTPAVVTALLERGSLAARELLRRDDIDPAVRAPIFEWCLEHAENRRRAVNHRVEGVVYEALEDVLQLGVPGPAAAWRRRLVVAPWAVFTRDRLYIPGFLMAIVGITEDDLLAMARERRWLGTSWRQEIERHPACTAAVRAALATRAPEPY